MMFPKLRITIFTLAIFMILGARAQADKLAGSEVVLDQGGGQKHEIVDRRRAVLLTPSPEPSNRLPKADDGGGKEIKSTERSSYENSTPDMVRCVCDPPCMGRDYCTTTGKCFVSQHEGSTNVVRDCFKDDEQANLYCHSKGVDSGNFKCCRGDLCNQNMTITVLVPQDTGADPQSNKEVSGLDKDLVWLIAAFGCLAMLLCAVAVFMILRRRSRLRQKELGLKQAASCKLLEADSYWKDDFRVTESSGSGRGQPHLVKQTVGKQVTLEKLIGKGRFGEVWRGKWRGEDVAVKTFSSREETSYKQECDIYNTILLRHDNILGFCAADTIGINSTTQHLLIMHFHRNGSLYDYLQGSDIDVEDMLILAHSAAAGLAHLHEEILEGGGRRVKPAIAHRDIKSKNILVKENGQCCIGDLGHAIRNDESLGVSEDDKKSIVKHKTNLLCFKDISHSESTDSLPSDSESKTVSEPVKLLVGTKRYMAPEVLNGELNPSFFESFKRVDVYAFGLVLWEICKRTRPYADVYHPPFWDAVPHDPSLDDMKKVVADEGQRPPIPNQWANDQILTEMSQMMQECWSYVPSSRLTMLRIKKNLHRKLNMMGYTGCVKYAGTGGSDKLSHCNTSGSASSMLCKYSIESSVGCRSGGPGGIGRFGRYTGLMRGGTSSGGESSSGVSGFSGNISETYSGRM